MTKMPEDDEPLDPVLENVRRKLMRSMAWSIGILMMGLLVLLFAIVYKINQTDNDKPEVSSSNINVSNYKKQIELGLEKTTKIISSELDHNRLKLHIENQDGTQEILIINLSNGEIVSRIALN